MKFICENYKSLKVYNDGVYISFSNGEYETTNKKEIALLKNISDVIAIDDSEVIIVDETVK